jgi:hypothetical protein
MTRFATVKKGVRPLPLPLPMDLWLTPDSDEDLHREPPTLRLHDSTTQLQPAIGESGAIIIGQRSLRVELAKLNNQGHGTSEEGGSLLKRRSLAKYTPPGQGTSQELSAPWRTATRECPFEELNLGKKMGHFGACLPTVDQGRIQMHIRKDPSGLSGLETCV